MIEAYRLSYVKQRNRDLGYLGGGGMLQEGKGREWVLKGLADTGKSLSGD